MSPPLTPFPDRQLEHMVNNLPNGRRRKLDVDLAQCQLMELVQYVCHLDHRHAQQQAIIQCVPVVKLFRKYVNDPDWRC